MRRGANQRSAGVSLIELSLILVIIGLMVLVAVAVVPRLTERMRLDTTREVTIQDVSRALTDFAASNGRLPCADTSAVANGFEGSGAAAGCGAAPGDAVGRVPYRTLGLPDPVLDASYLPLRYAVYRNLNGGIAADASLNADLAALTNRFIPVLPGHPATVDFPVVGGALQDEVPLRVSEGLNPDRKMPVNRNDLDFCLALRNAKAAAADTDHVHTLDLAGAAPPFNAAFVLASGGVEDADGSGGDIAFDGVNTGAGDVDFESPARRRNDGAVAAQVYDDLVHAVTFVELESRLSCAAITIGVNAAANIANAAAHMVVQMEDLLWVAEQNIGGNQTAITLAELGVALAVLQEVTAIADGIALGLNATCALTSTDAPAIAGAVATGIAAAVGIGLSSYALVLANQQVALNDAALAQAIEDAVVTNDIAARICVDAVNADARGGQGDAPPTPVSPPNRGP